MKLIAGFILGVVLSAGTVALMAQPERAMHPRIGAAITALRDARAYMAEAPHDFGGHKAAAIRDSRAALVQLRAAMGYRARMDR